MAEDLPVFHFLLHPSYISPHTAKTQTKALQKAFLHQWAPASVIFYQLRSNTQFLNLYFAIMSITRSMVKKSGAPLETSGSKPHISKPTQTDLYLYAY